MMINYFYSPDIKSTHGHWR